MQHFQNGVAAVLAVALLGLAAGCGQPGTASGGSSAASETQSVTGSTASAAAASQASQTATPADWSFTDALNRKVTIHAAPKRVVSLYGSFAEAWTLAGGAVVGTTQDAISERKMKFGDDVKVIGTNETLNMEQILALNPDFVILTSELSAQVKLDQSLTQANIPHAYFSCMTYQEYLDMMKGFTTLTGRPDLYEKNAAPVQKQVEAVIDKVPKDKPKPTAVLVRAYSTGAKAKGDDNVAGAIMKDLGVDNIVTRHQDLLEDISIEAIIQEDPDFIFVTTMGSDTQKALDTLKNGIEANPAWSGLKAVKENHYIVLPKDLFHYKPNTRWGESYEYLAKILYPDVFGS